MRLNFALIVIASILFSLSITGRQQEVDDTFSFNSIATKAQEMVVRLDVKSEQAEVQEIEPNMPFRFFFNQGDSSSRLSQRSASGVIILKDGNTYYILTTQKVVDGADSITATLLDRRTFPCTLVGNDRRTNIALLSFTSDDDDIVVAPRGRSADLQVGDLVLAVGNPLNFQSSVTAGIVSAIGRDILDTNMLSYIQSDAAMIQGSHGGALVNLGGELVGLNVFDAQQSNYSTSISFSIPIDDIEESILQIMDSGKVVYGWLGVSIQDVRKDWVEDIKLNSTAGAFIGQVYIDSPAYKGGIRPGDVVYAVESEPMPTAADLLRRVGSLRVGANITMSYYRNGTPYVANIIIAERQKDTVIADNSINLRPGFSVFPVNDDIREITDFEGEGMVVVSITPNGIVADSLVLEDIILEIDGQSVNTLGTFYQLINRALGKTIKMLLLRDGKNIEVEITL